MIALLAAIQLPSEVIKEEDISKTLPPMKSKVELPLPRITLKPSLKQPLKDTSAVVTIMYGNYDQLSFSGALVKEVGDINYSLNWNRLRSRDYEGAVSAQDTFFFKLGFVHNGWRFCAGGGLNDMQAQPYANTSFCSQKGFVIKTEAQRFLKGKRLVLNLSLLNYVWDYLGKEYSLLNLQAAFSYRMTWAENNYFYVDIEPGYANGARCNFWLEDAFPVGDLYFLIGAGFFWHYDIIFDVPLKFGLNIPYKSGYFSLDFFRNFDSPNWDSPLNPPVKIEYYENSCLQLGYSFPLKLALITLQGSSGVGYRWIEANPYFFGKLRLFKLYGISLTADAEFGKKEDFYIQGGISIAFDKKPFNVILRATDSSLGDFSGEAVLNVSLSKGIDIMLKTDDMKKRFSVGVRGKF